MTPQHSSKPPPPPRWWIAPSGETEGPHSHAFVLASLKGGRIDGNTLACREGSQEWIPIVDLPQFAVALGRERWRLHRGLAQDSLYHQKDVIALLRSGQVTSTTLACPEGGQEWKALLEWPAFAQTDPLQQPMSTKSVVSSADLHVDDGLITNSQLPAMGNWICIYCLIIRPILWLMDTTTTFVGGFENDTELFLCLSGSVLDTIVTAVLVVGGLRLRELRRSGPRIVKLALGMSLVILAVFLLIGLPLIAVSIDLQEEIQPMTTGDYLICLMLPIYLVEIVFQIIALTWLIQNGRRMKLVR